MKDVTAPAPLTRNQRRPDIQGLRGLAVVLVILYHSGLPVPGGFIGVDVFFVVSGYVITLMLVRELQATGSIDFGRFYRRRARRLLPALGLMLTVIAILSAAILGPLGQQQQALQTGIGASLFVANFQLIGAPGGYFEASAEVNPFLHTWSLSVEEQFYLFLPIALAVLWRLATRQRRIGSRQTAIAIAMFAVVTISFIVSYNLSTGAGVNAAGGQTEAFYSSVTRVWEFGIGVVLALAAHRLAALPGIARTALGTTGVGLITLGAFTIGATTPFPGLAAAMPTFGTAMLLAAGANSSPSWTTRALSIKPAVQLGDLSYSWYLWHWPFIVFAVTLWPTSRAAAPIAAAASLVPAALAYHHFEQPIRLGERFPNATGMRTATAAIVASLAALSVLAVSGQAVRDLPEVIELSHTIRYHIDATSGCASADVHFGTDCVLAADDAGGSVYLFGDSNAGQFTEPLVAAATQANFDLALAIRSGCPPIDIGSLHHGYPKDQCTRFPRDAMEAILRDRPDVVVLAAASDIYIRQEKWQLIDPDTDKVASTPDAKAELWQQGLESLLREFAQAGIDVRIVNPVPHFFSTSGTMHLAECPAARLVANTTTCAAQAPRETLDAERRQALQAEIAAVQAAGWASTVDFFDELCSGATCAMYTDGFWQYRDGTHLSIEGSLELTDDFYTLITGAG